MTPVLRPLDAADWERLRELRLFALRSEPGVFASNHARESAYDPAAWQTLLTAPGQQLYGLFAGDEMIGITGAVTSRDDPTGETALLVMSYIRPEYRRRGYSALFYAARLTWIRAQPQFRRVLVTHRASNEPSRRAIQRSGFVQIARNPQTWPDGAVEDEIHYELRLPQR